MEPCKPSSFAWSEFLCYISNHVGTISPNCISHTVLESWKGIDWFKYSIWYRRIWYSVDCSITLHIALHLLPNNLYLWLSCRRLIKNNQASQSVDLIPIFDIVIHTYYVLRMKQTKCVLFLYFYEKYYFITFYGPILQSFAWLRFCVS